MSKEVAALREDAASRRCVEKDARATADTVEQLQSSCRGLAERLAALGAEVEGRVAGALAEAGAKAEAAEARADGVAEEQGRLAERLQAHLGGAVADLRVSGRTRNDMFVMDVTRPPAGRDLNCKLTNHHLNSPAVRCRLRCRRLRTAWRRPWLQA